MGVQLQALDGNLHPGICPLPPLAYYPLDSQPATSSPVGKNADYRQVSGKSAGKANRFCGRYNMAHRWRLGRTSVAEVGRGNLCLESAREP